MKNETVYLQHIRDAIAKIESYTGDGKAAFLEQSIIQDSVIRNLEIIGEAARSRRSFVRNIPKFLGEESWRCF